MLIGFATHNRKLSSTRFLKSLIESDGFASDDQIIVFDDGSNDGTVESLQELLPTIQIIEGDGTYFWSKSMYEIHKLSRLQKSDLLMTNDDIELNKNALRTLKHYSHLHPDAIFVGGFCDAKGVLSYSGLQLKGGFRFKLELVEPALNDLKAIQSFNGNFFYIPYTVTNRIGLLTKFAHSYSDTEYGIRATKNKISIFLLPGFMGTCEFNTLRDSIFYSNMTLRSRYQIFKSVKGYPFKDLMKLYRLCGVKFWFAQFCLSYFGNFLKLLICHLFSNKFMRIHSKYFKNFIN